MVAIASKVKVSNLIYEMRLKCRKLALVSVFLLAVIAAWRISPYTPLPVDDEFHYKGDVPQTQHAIVCMIFTTPINWFTKGRAIQITWAKRCPFPIFFYSGSNVSEQHEIRRAHNTVALDVPEGRDWLTGKTLAGLRYSLDKYGDVAEWFMKADDDTYVIWENLEYLLDSYRSINSVPSYIGRKVSNIVPTGYASGGAGYLIRKHAVELIVHEGPKTTDCIENVAIEDTDIGRCLAHFKIYPALILDDFGRLKFHSDNPLSVLEEDPYFSKFYHINIFGRPFGNPNSRDEMLSHLAITFHYVTPGQMLMFDFLLYRLHRGARPPIHFSTFTPLLSTPSPPSSSAETFVEPTTTTADVTQKT